MDLQVCDNTKLLISWYDTYVRPFFEKTLDAERTAEFDGDREHLAKVLELSDTEVAVCFLGPSGIGKSTLINAIVGGAESIVPSGGIGPLTAQALVVRSQPERKLEVEYHGPARILRTVFGLEQMYKDLLGTPVSDTETPVDLPELEEDELPELQPDPEQETNPGLAISDPARHARRDQFRRSAQLLVTGSQDEDRDLPYLLDSLREVSGQKRTWGTLPDPSDADRLDGLRRALSFAKDGTLFTLGASTSDEEFQQRLHEHATGYLAPLIKNLTVHWPSASLSKSITLVDLPGVGVVRDVHADVTRKWIREKAHALVLVVDHRGMTEPLAEALRRSEFLNSLLYSADEPEEDPIVMVAITRIDDLADEMYRQDRNTKKYQYFQSAVDQAKVRLRAELQRGLEDIWLNKADASEGRSQVVRNLLATLQVHPLSAPEYARLIADDEDDRPFLRHIDQTGIPGFIGSLENLAQDHRERATKRVRERAAVFREQLTTTLRLIEAQWEGGGHAEGEAARLRKDLEVFIQPLRIELANRQGGYRNFLKKTMPRRIGDLITAAKAKSSKDIDRYLNKLGLAHWGTLRASVRRGGRYSGASDINLPTEFALRFEEPIAELWGKEILKDIRNETREYSDDCVALMEQVAEWALQQGTRVQPKIVEAQRDAIRADAKKLQNVGREMVKEMRDEAKARLVNAIEGPIKSACSGFVRKNLDVGPGVKRRILDLYEQLAEKVTDAAEEPARTILLKLFKDVEKEILAAFAERQDPLDSVSDAIVNSQKKYLERHDLQRRGQILEELRSVIRKQPDTQESSAAA
jgi:hypothetical protein